MRGRNASRVERSPNFIFVLFVVFFLVLNTTKYLYGEEFEPRKTRKLPLVSLEDAQMQQPCSTQGTS